MKLQRVMIGLIIILCGWGAFAIITAESALPYGPPISLELAKKVMDAAENEAMKNEWEVAMAIVDSGGHLVLFHKMDDTNLGAIDLSIGKAKTAVDFRQSSKNFEDRLAQGGVDLKLTKLNGLPMEGGHPLILDGKVIGAIGVAGAKSNEDGQAALAGAQALANHSK